MKIVFVINFETINKIKIPLKHLEISFLQTFTLELPFLAFAGFQGVSCTIQLSLQNIILSMKDTVLALTRFQGFSCTIQLSLQIIILSMKDTVLVISRGLGGCPLC